MTGRMFAPFQLPADFSCLHLNLSPEEDLSEKIFRLPKGLPQLWSFLSGSYVFPQAPSSSRALDKRHLISAACIGFIKLPAFLFPSARSFLLKQITAGTSCLFHHDQETVQKHKIRFWIIHCKNYKCLIHIGHCRTDQRIFAWKNLDQISRLLSPDPAL